MNDLPSFLPSPPDSELMNLKTPKRKITTEKLTTKETIGFKKQLIIFDTKSLKFWILPKLQLLDVAAKDVLDKIKYVAIGEIKVTIFLIICF